MKKLFLTIILTILFALSFFSPVLAVDNSDMPTLVNPTDKLQIKIPGMNLGDIQCTGSQQNKDQKCAVPWLANYVAGIYKYLLGIAAVLATITMMIGGFRWVISTGNPQSITEAKAWINGSIVGLIILFTSWILLTQVNPDLTSLKSISIGVLSELDLSVGGETSEIFKDKGTDCFINRYGKQASEIRTVNATFLGKQYQVQSEVAQALQNAQSQITSTSYIIKDGGGYNWRANVNNPKKLSLHSFGVAIDINPDQNPNYKKTSAGEICKTDIPTDIINALRNNGFKWGGDFSTVCDSMHFEWHGSCN